MAGSGATRKDEAPLLLLLLLPLPLPRFPPDMATFESANASPSSIPREERRGRGPADLAALGNGDSGGDRQRPECSRSDLLGRRSLGGAHHPSPSRSSSYSSASFLLILLLTVPPPPSSSPSADFFLTPKTPFIYLSLSIYLSLFSKYHPTLPPHLSSTRQPFS